VAQRATTTIPIFISTLTDPVLHGFVSSLEQPGGNITGVSGLGPELIGKQLELLKEAVPEVTRVAVLTDSTHPMVSPLMSEIEHAAQALGVRLQRLDVHGPQELGTALAAMTSERAEAIIVPPFPKFSVQRQPILEFAATHRLPVMATDRKEWVKEGGLMFYGVSITANHRRAAAFVDKILKGAKPADLPIERPTTFELVLNRASREG
jgi:putative ABC transport system substrate-binding protein